MHSCVAGEAPRAPRSQIGASGPVPRLCRAATFFEKPGNTSRIFGISLKMLDFRAEYLIFFPQTIPKKPMKPKTSLKKNREITKLFRQDEPSRAESSVYKAGNRSRAEYSVKPATGLCAPLLSLSDLCSLAYWIGTSA